MPKTIGPDGEELKTYSVMVPKAIYNALIQDGVENERTLSQTTRWALKQYIEMKEISKKRRVRYGTGLPTSPYSYVPRGWKEEDITLTEPVYDKETADADEIKETLDANEI